MNVPSTSHPLWKDIVTGKKQVQFDFLASKMMVGRISILLSTDDSEAVIQKSVQDLHDIFSKNINLPKVQNDLKKLFGEGGLS